VLVEAVPGRPQAIPKKIMWKKARSWQTMSRVPHGDISSSFCATARTTKKESGLADISQRAGVDGLFAPVGDGENLQEVRRWRHLVCGGVIPRITRAQSMACSLRWRQFALQSSYARSGTIANVPDADDSRGHHAPERVLTSARR